MAVLAIADGSTSGGVLIWPYLVVLAATAAGYMGVPMVGTAALGAAAAFASQGELNVAAVFITAVIGNEIGGLLGYKIGDRWGRRILGHPGPALELREKALVKGEAVYQKWGRAAVFFTPSLVSGTLRMNFRQFAFWNFLAGTVFVLAVGPAAYGAGRLAAGHHDLASIAMFVGGLVVGAICAGFMVRHHRRYKARRMVASAADRPNVEPQPPSADVPGPKRAAPEQRVSESSVRGAGEGADGR
jgi:membrane protein DedA with SNARE-associated domain